MSTIFLSCNCSPLFISSKLVSATVSPLKIVQSTSKPSLIKFVYKSSVKSKPISTAPIIFSPSSFTGIAIDIAKSNEARESKISTVLSIIAFSTARSDDKLSPESIL